MSRDETGGVDHIVQEYFGDDGSPKKCPKCGSVKFTKKVVGVVDVYCGGGPECEVEYFCGCGECVGFWAYGSWHPAAMDGFRQLKMEEMDQKV